MHDIDEYIATLERCGSPISADCCEAVLKLTRMAGRYVGGAMSTEEVAVQLLEKLCDHCEPSRTTASPPQLAPVKAVSLTRISGPGGAQEGRALVERVAASLALTNPPTESIPAPTTGQLFLRSSPAPIGGPGSAANGWGEVYYPYQSGRPTATVIAADLIRAGVDPDTAVPISALAAALSSSYWWVLDFPWRQWAATGWHLPGGVPFPWYKEGVGGEGPMAIAHIAVNLAADRSGHLSLFEDPAAMIYARSLGVIGPDELLTSPEVVAALLLWVIANRRADLLDSFALGPLNQWLGNSKLYTAAGGLPDAPVSPVDNWAELADLFAGSGRLGGLLPLLYKSGATEGVMASYKPGKQWEPHPDLLASCRKVIIKMGNEQRWRLHASDARGTPPSMIKTGVWPAEKATFAQGDLVGTFASFVDVIVADLAQAGLSPKSWGTPAPYSYGAEQTNRAVGAIGQAFLTTASTIGTAMGGSAGIMSAVLGKSLATAMAHVWADLGAYVSTSWTAVTHCPIGRFITQQKWPAIWQSLEKGVDPALWMRTSIPGAGEPYKSWDAFSADASSWLSKAGGSGGISSGSNNTNNNKTLW